MANDEKELLASRSSVPPAADPEPGFVEVPHALARSALAAPVRAGHSDPVRGETLLEGALPHDLLSFHPLLDDG
jgi:hypothetical protein